MFLFGGGGGEVLSITNKRLVRTSLDTMRNIAVDKDKTQYAPF